MAKDNNKWVAIPGTDSTYFANRLGQIKSVIYFGNKVRERILKPVLKDGRYLVINLGSKNRNHYVHRIIATTFIPNPNNRPEVNHKDFDRQNNSVDNLEWVTRQENSDHLHKNKKVVHPSKKGEKNANSKLNFKQVLEIRSLSGLITITEMAQRFGVSQSCIQGIIKRRIWQHI